MKNKIGIALEGGATRGMYTAGVLDVLLEENIEADIVAGVSAGCLFGVNYLSKQNGRAIRYNKKFNKDKTYMGLYPLLKEGNIINSKYAFKDVPEVLDPFDDETFKKSKAKFYGVCTNVKTGKAEYIHIDSVFDKMEVLRASGSMPFVSKAVKYEDNYYLDGALSDNVPYKWVKKQGVDKLIVVLTRDITYKKKKMSKLLTNLYRFKYKKISKALEQRYIKYNETIEELKVLEKENKAFVIRPSRPIVMAQLERNPDILQEVYDLGRSDCKRLINDLKEYLNH